MGNLSHDQAVSMFNAVNGAVAVFAVIVLIVRIVLVILLFILVIKAIQYFHNKNKYNCATCKYKQNCIQQELQNSQSIIQKDG